MAFYVRIRGQVFGPLQEQQVVTLIQQGKFGRMNEISTDKHQWVRADEFEQFFPKPKPKPKSPFIGEIDLSKDDAPTGTSASNAWYYSDDGKTGLGPYPQSDIEQMIRQGDITGQTILWHDQLDPQKAESVAEFARLFRKPAKSGVKRNRDVSQYHQASDGAPSQHGTLPQNMLRQIERAGTWSFVMALGATIGMGLLVVSQLFQLVLIVRTNLVLLTLGFLLVTLVVDLVTSYLVFTLWRCTNQLKHTLREANDPSLTLAVKRMAEYWRACVLAPTVLCVFTLLATLLAFAAGLNSLKIPMNMLAPGLQNELPVVVPPTTPGVTPSRTPTETTVDQEQLLEKVNEVLGQYNELWREYRDLSGDFPGE